jgi:hypothetical protein
MTQERDMGSVCLLRLFVADPAAMLSFCCCMLCLSFLQPGAPIQMAQDRDPDMGSIWSLLHLSVSGRC